MCHKPHSVQPELCNWTIDAARCHILPLLLPALANNDSFTTIIAQDMVLHEEFECLPPVILGDCAPLDLASSLSPSPTVEAFAALGARTHKLEHLDIRLDWYGLIKLDITYL